MFRPGRGAGGELPPNDWVSVFGGPAWTRVDPTAAGRVVPPPVRTRAARPELAQPRGRGRLRATRCGSGSTAASTASGSTSRTGWSRPRGCPTSAAHLAARGGPRPRTEHPHWDRDDVHDDLPRLARGRRLLPRRAGVRRRGVGATRRPAGPLRARPTSCTPRSTSTSWARPGTRRRCGATIDRTLRRTRRSARRPPGCCPTTTSARHVTRYGRELTTPASRSTTWPACPATSRLGTRRARAAALLMLALPGGAYVYQGEELGLPRGRGPAGRRAAGPDVRRTGGTEPRAATAAGCRSRGPGPAAVRLRPRGRAAPPWLPQPAVVGATSPSSGAGGRPGLDAGAVPGGAAHPAPRTPALGDGGLRWLDAPEGALAFARDPGFGCMVNLSGGPVPLPAAAPWRWPAARSTAGGQLPPDTAVWLTD